MSRAATKSTVEKTEEIVREYLSRNDNGRGETFFKASDIAEDHDDMTPRRAGRGLAEIENSNVSGLGVERWGKSRSTRWRAFYTD
jgi:hypothetical protein